MATSTIKEISAIPQAYTGYTFVAYSQTDAQNSYVYIVGKLCVFSLSMKYASHYTPSDTQVFIRNMPKPKSNVLMQGMTWDTTANQLTSFKAFRYLINTNGEIQNYYSGLKTIANNPTVFSGVYVIA